MLDTKDAINLRVLQHQDKAVASILKQSPYVVLYKYSVEESAWSKLPFEGTLFIYRNHNGTCGYRILNRLSLDLFSRSLDSEEDVMETEGYVIHRVGEEIFGFWIWDGEDRTNIFTSMQQAATESREASKQSRQIDSDLSLSNTGHIANLVSVTGST